MNYLHLLLIMMTLCSCGAVYVDDVRVLGGGKYDDHNYMVEIWNKTDFPISIRYKRVSMEFKVYDIEDQVGPGGSAIAKVKRNNQSADIIVSYGGVEKLLTIRLAYLEDKAKAEIDYNTVVGFHVR